MKNKEVIKSVTKDSTEYLLQNPPETYKYYGWNVDKDNIFIRSNSLYWDKNHHLSPVDSTKVPISSIRSLSLDEFEADRTAITLVLVLSITILLAGCYVAYAAFQALRHWHL